MIDSKENALAAHISRNSGPIDPISTGESPRLESTGNIRALAFDIYGTLFISGCGDISLIQNEDRSPAFCAALTTAGYNIFNESAPWSDAFMESMKAFREKRMNQGISFPEVRIEEVWTDFIATAESNKWLGGTGDLKLAIVDFECRVNPCWPMPNLEMALDSLTKRGLPMGIVSNAQFYTPLMFQAFLGKPMADCGFMPDLSVWSYREREGKPSPRLYEKLEAAFRAKGISAGEVLYVGNDLRNDIWPAQVLGFRTALFAGDKRSLRWRQDDPDCQEVRPDVIITDLQQILKLV